MFHVSEGIGAVSHQLLGSTPLLKQKDRVLTCPKSLDGAAVVLLTSNRPFFGGKPQSDYYLLMWLQDRVGLNNPGMAVVTSWWLQSRQTAQCNVGSC